MTEVSREARRRRPFPFLLPEYCKGCGRCIPACPKELLAFVEDLNSRGVHYVCCIDNEACTGCLSCAVVCPDAAIQILKVDEATATK